MTCLGGFTGGELCLPDLDVKLRFLPGDVIMFRSAVLQHFIRATIGERSSCVFFSYTDPHSIKQNTHYLEEDDPSYQQAIADKGSGLEAESRETGKGGSLSAPAHV
jgi:predicted 2-oxoglutarate/Fe(II)-dependent dioxygenase YbiX